MTELEKLDRYLTEHKYPHIRKHLPYFDSDGVLIQREFNQIVVFEPSDDLLDNHIFADKPMGVVEAWDVVCYRGTEGAQAGLLEINSRNRSLVNHYYQVAGVNVESNLTADDIIARLEARG